MFAACRNGVRKGLPFRQKPPNFRGLPPGEYLVAAIDDIEPNEWFDPALLQRLLPTAFKIAIAEGEDKVQDIRLGSGG